MRAPRFLALCGTVLTAACALVLVPSAQASAHPLGNFTVNRYDGLVAAPGQLRVDHVEDLAEIPATQAKPDIKRLGMAKLGPAAVRDRSAGQRGHGERVGGDTDRGREQGTPAAGAGGTRHPARGVPADGAAVRQGHAHRGLPGRGRRPRPRLARDHRPWRPDDARLLGRTAEVRLGGADPVPQGAALLARRHRHRVAADPPRRPRPRRGTARRSGRLRAPARRRPLDPGPERPGGPPSPHLRLRLPGPAHRRGPGGDARARARPWQDPDGRDGGGARGAGPGSRTCCPWPLR